MFYIVAVDVTALTLCRKCG